MSRQEGKELPLQDTYYRHLLERLLSNPVDFSRNYQRNPPEFLDNNNNICCFLNERQEGEEENSSCPGKNLGYLGKKGKVAVPYLIEIDGVNFVLKTSTPGQLSLVYSNNPPSNFSSFKQELDKSPSKCGYPSLDELKYLGGDEFTNEMLIGIILTRYFDNWNKTQETSFYPCVEYLASSICSTTKSRPIGAHLLEFADLGTLHDFAIDKKTQKYRCSLNTGNCGSLHHEISRTKLGNDVIFDVMKPEVIFIILRQVISALHILQDVFDYNHGDLKAANILISSTPSSGQYEGVDVSAPFTCKIADYGKSSLTLETNDGDYRLYNRTWLADRYLYLKPFIPNIYLDRGEPFFTIKGIIPHLYTRTRHMGLPFYLAFDTYCFIVSILLIPSFYYSFFETKKLIDKVWSPLWFGKEGNIIRQRIVAYHNNPGEAHSMATIVELLREIKLRCNATEILLKNLRYAYA